MIYKNITTRLVTITRNYSNQELLRLTLQKFRLNYNNNMWFYTKLTM